VNLALARTTRPRTLLVIIDHRVRQPFTEDAWSDYFGFDAGGMKIGLGLRYGILRDLDVGMQRVNGTYEVFDTYELDLRWRFLRQSRHYLDAAVRAGITWFPQPDLPDALGGFGQLLATRTLWSRLTLSLAVLFHSESSGPEKSNLDTAWSLAVGGLALVRLAKFLVWSLEVSGTVAGYGARWPAFSSAVSFLTHRHVFSLVLSNTQYLSADGIVASTPYGFRHLVVGFQIQRELAF